VDAEAIVAIEVERFIERRRSVSAAPAIVALQRRAEEIRQAELERARARLGPLTPEQAAAVEALTRGLVNKFLHPPMQALKQAARENDSTRVEALCDAWSLPSVADQAGQLASMESSATEPRSEPAREDETSAVGGK